MARKTIEVRCLELNQPIGMFYIGVMNYDDLIKISVADIRRLEDRDLDDYMGIQRNLSPARVQELQKYVNTVDATFPTSVILSISSEDAEYHSTTRALRVRADKEVAKIIDGQHRIAGLEGYRGAQPFQINVTIFVDMDIEDQAMVFATINLAQTKPNKSLVYDLYEYTRSRSPQKTCHTIARLLNSRSESPFEGRIKILGVAPSTSAQAQPLTQATFVEALLRYISGGQERALEDRDMLKRGKRMPKASDLATNHLVFRDMFIASRDAEIARVVWNYFDSIKQRWPKSWGNLNQRGNILPRTNGFRAFMRLFPLVYEKLGRGGSVPQTSEFYEVMLKCKIADGGFTSDRYQPGTSGETALFKQLLKYLR